MTQRGILTRASGRRRRGRRRRLLTRGLPLVCLAAVAFAAGLEAATWPTRDARRVVQRYVTAWQRRDYRQMYRLLDARSRRRISERAFARRLAANAATATLTTLDAVHVGRPSHQTLPVSMRIGTRLWGVLDETLSVPLSGRGSRTRVRFADQLLFPGLGPGERLHRRIALPRRGTLLAHDGTPLAQGPDRTSPIPGVAGQIVGMLGPAPPSQAAAYAAAGYPRRARVGLDGLEYIFQRRLAGRLGGTLLAGHRVLARVHPRPGATVRTTIDPSLEQAAIAALGAQYGGIAVMNPRTGALQALAGIAFSAPQPPGSTMKIITATAALQAGIVTLHTTFPVSTGATLEGYTLHNADNEACGGTLLSAFAVSCNSVFAPLGAKLGARRLVATAKRFGFDQPPSIPSAARSTIPTDLAGALAVGSSAIGQGQVQTTPLEMADVAATIAMRGRRPIPTLLAHQHPRFVRVTSAKVAGEVQQMMEAVVQYGTGTAAQIPGVTVAGKTGTAEIGDTVNPNVANPKNTDAWFVGYAPAGHPKVVAGALFPNQGAGGAAAAPAVRSVLVAALGG